MFAENESLLCSRGMKLDMAPEHFGELRSSHDSLKDCEELHRRMAQDGYLFLPGLLNTEDISLARLEILNRLEKLGYTQPGYPLAEGVAKEGFDIPRTESLVLNNNSLEKVLYSGPMMDFYEYFLGGEVRHYDYTWLRTKSSEAKSTTQPHCDVVYMGRGTQNLYTSWTPLQDIPLKQGGLICLENSHKHEELQSTYGQLDVDKYCSNNEESQFVKSGMKVDEYQLWKNFNPIRVKEGSYSDDPIAVGQEIGGRWLSANYQAGDVLVFHINLMHAALDNETHLIRISSDSRYQLACENIDERWVGDTPVGHGPESKIGMIC